MENVGGGRGVVVGAALLVVVLAAVAAEGRCTVRNDSGQALEIVPTVHGAASVTCDVDSFVVLQAPQQHCYFRNPHTGHRSKAPVMLASGRTYAIVDSEVQGEVNVCLTSFFHGLLNYGAVISAGI